MTSNIGIGTLPTNGEVHTNLGQFQCLVNSNYQELVFSWN
jgi:hypothetical protein